VYADPSGPHGQFEEAREVAVSDDGRVYAAGWRDTGWPYDGDEAVVISLDTAGVVRWEYRYNPTPESVDVAEDIAVGPNGRVYAAGTSWSPGAGPDIILVCLDADPPGVAERPSRAGLHQTRSATIVRGILFLPSSLLSPHSSLLSIDGRKALDLVPGPNDVSRLAPGVYFVCSGPSAVSRQPTAVQKVVVTR
jgi:hypothetical protein